MSWKYHIDGVFEHNISFAERLQAVLGYIYAIMLSGVNLSFLKGYQRLLAARDILRYSRGVALVILLCTFAYFFCMFSMSKYRVKTATNSFK